MPFAAEFDWLHEEIVAAGRDVGIEVRRADDIFRAGAFIDQVRDEVGSADLIVAVCTGRNPNVFYELGIAESHHTPILIAAGPHDLPSDVHHFRAQFYGGSTEAESRGTLKNRVAKALRETLTAARTQPVRALAGPQVATALGAGGVGLDATPTSQYESGLALLKAGDISGFHRQRRLLAARLITTTQEWLDASANGSWPNAINDPQKLESWLPIYSSLLGLAEPDMRRLTAIATAPVELNSPGIRDVADNLVDLFRLARPERAPSTWIGNLPQLLARLAVELLLARAVAVGAWSAFYELARTPLAETNPKPWVLDRRFTHPDSIGMHAEPASKLSRQFIRSDEVWSAMGFSSQDAEAHLADANFLLSVVDVALAEQSVGANRTYCWGLIERTHPAILRQLLVNPEAVRYLALLANEPVESFRMNIRGRVQVLLQNLTVSYPMGYWHVSDEAAALLKAIADREEP